VSPLWRDEVGVHVSPRRVLMLRVQRGFKRAVTATHEHSIICGDANDWRAPLGVLDQLLERSQWQGASLRVVLADNWVRYALVPWAMQLRSTDEHANHARQVLVRLYGNTVSEWEICLSQTPPGHARVACAMPAELLRAVREIRTRHRMKLTSLQPQLLAAYDNWRHRLPASGAWFVTIGEGTLAAARLGARAWDRIHSLRIGADWTRDLKRLQTFGRLACAHPEEGRVYVDAPTAWREEVGSAANDLHWLEEDPRLTSTLHQLGRMRRLAA
jgi:hypothetical protein